MAPLQPEPPSSGNGGWTCLHPDGRGVIKACLLPPRVHSHHDSSLLSLVARGEVPYLALLSCRLPISQMGMLTEVERVTRVCPVWPWAMALNYSDPGSQGAASLLCSRLGFCLNRT